MPGNSNAGQDVTLLVRKPNRERIERDGIPIRCKDERLKKSEPMEVVYHPVVVDELQAQDRIECIFFDHPQLVTMLGERDGQVTPRLEDLRQVFENANLRPVLSQDILGWLTIHYVEFLGVIGGIIKAGSFDAFVGNSALIKESVLATRESLDICKARGVDFKKAAPANIHIIAIVIKKMI